MVHVSDSWRASVVAMKKLGHAKGWSEQDLPHELVNHSQGEIVNPHGYNANQIESKWSVLKRWARKKYGGKLPGSKDRAAWTALLEEFQYRKCVQYQSGRAAGDAADNVKYFLRAVAANRVRP